MADNSVRFEGLKLPPLNELTRELRPCPAGCGLCFSSGIELHQHVYASHRPMRLDVQMESSPEDPAVALYQGRPMNRQQPSYTVSSLDISSPSASTDSEGSMPTFSPSDSRAPSLGPFDRRALGTGPARTSRRASRSSRSGLDARYGNASGEADATRNGDKKSKKMQKEKENRAEQAAVLWRTEDRFRTYLGYDRKEQSGGNGNGAGLYANKINILRGSEGLLQSYLDREYRAALANGRLAEWQAQMLSFLEAAPEAVPFAGTLLQGNEDDFCTHADSKSKECLTHGHPDWRECRRLHTQNRFDMNVHTFRTQLRQGQMTGQGQGRSSATSRRQS